MENKKTKWFILSFSNNQNWFWLCVLNKLIFSFSHVSPVYFWIPSLASWTTNISCPYKGSKREVWLCPTFHTVWARGADACVSAVGCCAVASRLVTVAGSRGVALPPWLAARHPSWIAGATRAYKKMLENKTQLLMSTKDETQNLDLVNKTIRSRHKMNEYPAGDSTLMATDAFWCHSEFSGTKLNWFELLCDVISDLWNYPLWTKDLNSVLGRFVSC